MKLAGSHATLPHLLGLVVVVWSGAEIVAVRAVAAEPAQVVNKVELDKGLKAHWKLAGDTKDHSGHGHDAQIRGGVDLTAEGRAGKPGTAAAFNGRDAYLEVPASEGLRLAKDRFAVSAWIHTERQLDDVPGDLVSQYDPSRRRGFHLSLKTSAGVTTTQANFRQLQFGIDDNRQSEWLDCGRPGEALLIFALCTHKGLLYAGTCEPGEGASGHVYTYVRSGMSHVWRDLEAPAPCNAVTALAEFDEDLYAGVGKYRVAGSALEESTNPHLGGRIYRYGERDQSWIDCGQLLGVEAIGGLVVYRGKLYASSLYKPSGFYRYESGTQWTPCPVPDGKRVEAMCVYNGYLYATSYDGGHVYRFDGTSLTDCGQLGDPQENTQTYSFAVYEGRLYVGTWRSGKVYRFEDVNRWTDVGRLGEELEVMGMLVHNGRLVAGTLPLAEVYSYEGEAAWKKLTRLDLTPDVKYRRAWTMGEHQGQLYVSTLPSGKLHSTEVGVNITADSDLGAGWHHVVAQKSSGSLAMWIDGKKLQQEHKFDEADYDLTVEQPTENRLGGQRLFCGRMQDVRLYGGPLNQEQIESLAGRVDR